MSQRLEAVSAVSLAAVLGLTAVLVPGFFSTARPSHPHPLFSTLAVGVEQAGGFTLLGLFVAGLAARLLLRAPSWLVGLATVSLLPLCATLEMVVQPTSHSLWPIEFFIYALGAVPGLLGAYLGAAISSRFRSHLRGPSEHLSRTSRP